MIHVIFTMSDFLTEIGLHASFIEIFSELEKKYPDRFKILNEKVRLELDVMSDVELMAREIIPILEKKILLNETHVSNYIYDIQELCIKFKLDQANVGYREKNWKEFVNYVQNVARL